MRVNRGDRWSGKDRRSGGDRRRFEDRRKFRDRRSGEDRRKLRGQQYRGAVKRGRESIDEDPKCQRCIATLGELRVLILECPFPQKGCMYKQYYEIIHYVTYPSARAENGSAVVASCPDNLLSSSIILIRPDPILESNQIYYIDVTDSQTI